MDNVAPPLFTSSGGSSSQQRAAASRGNPAINLDDIFGDVAFTPDGDTVFLSEEKDEEGVLNSGEGANVANYASRQDESGNFVAASQGGGLYTTNLADSSKPSLVMGAAGSAQQSKAVPFRHTPQASHHLQYAHKKKKSSSRSDRKMSEQQKVERRYVIM